MSREQRRKLTIGALAAAGVIAAAAVVLASRSPIQLTADIPPSPQPRVAPVATVNPPQPVVRPKVDVVFVLDTTGSMGGLLAGAKRKIWSIANQVLSGQPRPELRLGLVGYRDRGDAYVTRVHSLTEDIDEAYGHLLALRAGGGGDMPEHVNRGLADAIRKMQWRKGENVLRQIYLVGDAPPHEGRQGLYSARLAAEAAEKGIVINAVRCGGMAATQTAWRRIARASGGIYASVQQDGAMVSLDTPMDGRLAALNAELSRTALLSGSEREQQRARGRMTRNAHMSDVSQAESAVFRARSGRLDSGDLLDKLRKGKKLSEIPVAELPAAVAAKPAPARQAYVKQIGDRRARIKREILRLSSDRHAYLRRAKAAKKRPKSFDDVIGEGLKAQGGKAGVKYE